MNLVTVGMVDGCTLWNVAPLLNTWRVIYRMSMPAVRTAWSVEMVNALADNGQRYPGKIYRRGIRVRRVPAGSMEQ